LGFFNFFIIIGDWGLGIGYWAQSLIPNPQSPIPNPQIIYLILISKIKYYLTFKYNKIFKNKLLLFIFNERQ